MLTHIVLIKLKEGVNQSQIEALYKNVLSLKDKIPGILSMSCGCNNSPEGKNHGFTYGFVIRFSDSHARDNYLPHPEHQRVARDYILPIAEDVLVFDYNINITDS